ncbi:GntR family transcriptional regulator [Nocardioides jensenii]|uniref:GntR family transcriptional regulator n=1 Tax=Nocardioides jensenii TaxID=1843 RepID=UPI001FDEF6A2|nr:GntR family transcriptional regulator [Nocardioides jensenii]
MREYLRELIDGLPVGSPAPSERDLVGRFGVARMTVRQAIEALVAEGLLERIPGKGTFVKKPRTRVGELRGFTDEMASRGKQADSLTLISRIEKAGPGVARALAITEGDAVIHWQRLRHADGEPVCVENAYLSEVLLPGFLQRALPVSLYAELGVRGLRPGWAEDSVRADLATAEEAELLGLPDGSPVLRISRRASSDDRVIEVSSSTYRADSFTLWVQFADR